MKKSLLALFYLPMFLFAQSQRQTVYLSVPECYVQSFTPLPGGGNLLSGYSRYGTDSALVNLIFLNDSDEITMHKEFNTSTDFDFVSQVIPFSNGYLIGGKSSDPSFFHPQVIRTDANGNVLWAKYFQNTSYWQGQVIRIIPNGNAYSMYTFAETPFNDFYRMEGDAAGNAFTGWQYTPDTGMSFRIFDAEPMSNSSSHILCGHANFNTSASRGGLLMKTSPGGIQWSRHITAGGNFKNDIVDVAAGADGNSYSLFVCENMPGNQYSTIVLKFDSLGNKIWAKQLSVSNGTLNGCSIIESSSHDFYVASYDNLLIAYLSKLDASGNLLWTHRWDPSASGGATALKLFKDAGNNMVLAGKLINRYFVSRLDANGGGCSFSNSNAIAAATVNTVLTPVSFSAAAFSPAAVSEQAVYSSVAFGEDMICGGLGIEEGIEKNGLLLYPDPVQDKLMIDNSQITKGNLVIYNAVGEKVYVGAYQAMSEVDCRNLTPGIYFIELTGGKKVLYAKFLKN